MEKSLVKSPNRICKNVILGVGLEFGRVLVILFKSEVLSHKGEGVEIRNKCIGHVQSVCVFWTLIKK